jgi:putative redox protein
MADTKPPAVVDLTWEGKLAFTARERGHAWVLDGRSEAGPSPVAALGAALAGCLAMDVAHLLAKGRFEVRRFSARLTGRRAESDPRRFVSIELSFALDTNAPRARVERAVALSREKYCSVWHSMRQDIEFTTRHDVLP